MIDDVIDFFEPHTYLIIGSVKAFAIAGALLGIVPALVWLERRLMGRFQVRLGPNRVGPFGLGQPISDSIKLSDPVKTIILKAAKPNVSS